MQRVLELVFRPTVPATRLAATGVSAAAAPAAPANSLTDAPVGASPDVARWLAVLANHAPLAGVRHDQAKFALELHHCDDPPSGDPAWQCLVLDAGARRFAIAVHDWPVLPGLRVRSWEPVALTRDQLPDFAGQCGDVPWRADVERHWWRLDHDGAPLTISLDAGVLSAPATRDGAGADGGDGENGEDGAGRAGGERRSFVELRISLELADVDNPDDAAPDLYASPDADTRIELAARAVRLFDLALELNADGLLTLVEHDALTRASQSADKPRKAGPIDFGARQTYASLAAAVARNVFAQWIANVQGVVEGQAIEYVHQMRIALRRMRTAYRFFGPELDAAALVAEQKELKWIAALLGDVRDWDVLAEETFEAVARAAREASAESPADVQARDAAQWDAARGRVAAHRARAAQALREAMTSPRYARLVMQIARQVAVLVAQAKNRRARPLNPDARRVLNKRYRKLARVADLASLTPDARHQVRIDAKRLRYAIEFLAPALDGRARRRMMAHVSVLQDTLGSANDAIVGRRLLAEVELDAAVRMFTQGYLSATEAHGVSGGKRELDRIRAKK
ncbi:CHAD domain-containing protein [Pararobbsia silviterrae]|uniref:CHAD domain-containing protein n=1 Tax=Pararobbsia silviterrae TaxID=1792498 RepID=A0A494Y454_9BURK|nr:CHAD domain-containing protein [Pararobbsia silviterrae]RKP57519.1 CHAD domain-containing protein [Pararobbsia silviterrae]